MTGPGHAGEARDVAGVARSVVRAAYAEESIQTDPSMLASQGNCHPDTRQLA
jgi:hypothetical protein